MENQNMENQNVQNQNMNVSVTVENKKSNAAWICGLIGFITSIPNSFCALICAGASVAAAGLNAGLDEQGNFDEKAADAAADSAATGAAVLLWAVLLVSVLCFILSFLGKSKSSKVTGVILILGGVFILVNGFIGFGSMLWGTATGSLYLVSGIVSIINHKRAN